MYIKYYASIFVKSVCINVYIVKESLKDTCLLIHRLMLEKIKQSIQKEINSEYSLEGLMLKLQCFGHLM